MSLTGWGYFELDLWHISYIIGGRNPRFSVWIHLGVVECHTLFIDHCVSFMKIYCLWGYFINFLTQFMILPNNQLSNSASQRYLYRWHNPFLYIEEKIELYQINIYIFSFNAAPIQHDTGKNKLFNFPKSQTSTL